jgi:hypothetical protein
LPAIRGIDQWIKGVTELTIPGRRRVLYRYTPPMPQFLYKYSSSGQKYSHENLRDVIVGSVLRLHAPSDFNDPFEMAAQFTTSATLEEKRARYEALARQQAPHLGWRGIQARMAMLMMISDASFESPVQTSLRQIRETMGVYCFAGSARNLLMWSHYAADHRGVCLQFERLYDLPTLAHAVRVDYVADLPVVNWVTNLASDVGKVLLAKSPCWSYEQESRIIVFGQANCYLPFAPQALRRIVIGCRADATLVDALNSWLSERESAGHPPITVLRATMHPRKYKLIIKRAA